MQQVNKDRARRMESFEDALRAYRPTEEVRKAAKAAITRRKGPVTDAIKAESIVRHCDGGTAVLFATGPSLSDEVVSQVRAACVKRKIFLFGCNDAYRMVSGLDAHYACDAKWWRVHYADIAQQSFPLGMWTQEPHLSQAEFPLLHRIAGKAGNGLSGSQDLIHFGNNSGYQLINVAFLHGIKKMILCGYNMKVVKGQRHFFGDHPQGLNRSGNYTGFAKHFNTIKPEALGIEIINATPDTALTAFPKMSLEDALKD